MSRKAQLSPAAYKHKLEYAKAWGKRNRHRTAAASRRYRSRVTKLVGTSSAHGLWLHHMLKEAKDAEIRKHRATTPTPLPRQLVETRKRL